MHRGASTGLSAGHTVCLWPHCVLVAVLRIQQDLSLCVYELRAERGDKEKERRERKGRKSQGEGRKQGRKGGAETEQRGLLFLQDNT